MKQLLRAGIICFSVLALGTFLLSLYKAGSLYTQYTGPAAAPLNYHFALYLPEPAAGAASRTSPPDENRDSFFSGMVLGAERAAEEVHAAISIHSIDPEKFELEMASYTGVDGVIVCPYLDDALARRQLDKLGSRQIPVVIVNHNIPNDQPWPFIGANNFDLGRRIGQALGQSDKGPIQLAMVYSEKSPGIYGERELVEMGIITALGDRLETPITGFRTNLNPLDAEELLNRIFRFSSPSAAGINTIVFTDPSDTMAAAQTLVDMNLVGHVQVIGFGDDPGIQENIRKGVISFTVAIDPERIGYEAVRSLHALRNTGYTPTAIDMGIKILNQGALQ
ncbi:MAG: substrate-binding domain-containing protein [Treponema sp.]|nr:substrate-binding domain-containing protein [Treponema sp.]